MMGIVESILACRRTGHDWGMGAGIIVPIVEGQTQVCSVCEVARARRNGLVTYYAPPALTMYPKGEVK